MNRRLNPKEQMPVQNLVNKIRKDHYAGALMFFIGVCAALQGTSYKMGTLGRMGPGYFPTALGIILALMGVAIFIMAGVGAPPMEKKKLPPEWRAWFCICFSIVAFAVIGLYGGLVPATFAIVFISALADRQNTVRNAALLSAAMVAISVLVFWWALQLAIPLFRWG
jgi:Tripartite tricarboxylate transporter TctB family